MKLSTVLLVIATLQIMATGYSQPLSLNLNMDKTSVRELLKEIERQTELSFIFSDDISSLDNEVSVNVHNRNIKDVLNQLFKGTDLDYQILNEKLIVIASKEVLQGNVITGKVTDTEGEPLPGASVAIKGTGRGTITDANGFYTLQVPNDNAILVFSYIGFATQEIMVGSQRSIDIVLSEDTRQIEEVVVVGYGTVNRHAVTGSVSVAKLDVYKDVPSNTFLDRVKGTIPGLNIDGVSRTTSNPGWQIRGQNSIGSNNSPLLVVDGSPYSGNLGDISPHDILSLTVLKDASAASVYGSRSANGVVIIETKRGEGVRGKPVFNFDINYGISNQMRQLKVYEGDDYLQRILDIRSLYGQEADRSKIELYMEEEERRNYLATPDHRPTFTNPYGLMSRQGYSRDINFSVANRMEKTRYYISTSIIDQTGVEINDQYKYYSGRVNIDSDITSWLNIAVKSFYNHRDVSGSLPGIQKVYLSPWCTLKDEDGNYLQYPQTTSSATSPFWSLATEHVRLQNNLQGTVTATVKVPWVEGLSYTATFYNALRWELSTEFWDENTNTGKSLNGSGFRSATHSQNMLLDNMLKYNRRLKEKHSVDLTLLLTQEKWKNESLRTNAQGFNNTSLGTYRLQDGQEKTVTTGGSSSESLGIMARGTYTFDDKYSITGTVRRDGYSAFSEKRKFGVFPSIGVNWNIGREGFMDNSSFFNNLAVRASYGSNGNQSIGLYQTLARVNMDGRYLYYGFDNEPENIVTTRIASMATDVKWERTVGLNLGVDFGFLGRINGSVDIYKKNTFDMLYYQLLPRASGMGDSGVATNIGQIQNRGIELSLNTLNVDQPDFKWHSYVAFSLNRNKIITLLGDKDEDGNEKDLPQSNYFIGKSLGAIYDYKVIGMYQQEDVDNGTIMAGWRPGEYMLEDVDGNGTITSDKDRQILGYNKENFRWSLTNTFEYKGFSLMFFVNSIWGGNGWYLSDAFSINNMYEARTSINCAMYDYWTPQNTGAFFQRPEYGSIGAVRGYKRVDRSFIKLQKIALTYNVGKWVRPWKIDDMIVGFNVNNLFTYAPHWIGLDPETDQGVRSDAVPSIRTYNMSVSIKF